MAGEINLWKQRIAQRKAQGQTIDNWCEEHNITKGSYHYWRKKIQNAAGSPGNTSAPMQPITFAKIQTSELTDTALKITWQDVSFQLTSNQEARLAAEVIAHLRGLC